MGGDGGRGERSEGERRGNKERGMEGMEKNGRRAKESRNTPPSVPAYIVDLE